MKQSIFTIVRNDALTDCVYKMILSGDTSAITPPVNLSISHWRENSSAAPFPSATTMTPP